MPGALVELGEDAFADRGGVCGVVESDPEIDPRSARAVGDVDDSDLAVIVHAEIGRHSEFVAEGDQCRPDAGQQLLSATLTVKCLKSVTQNPYAVGQPRDISFVGESPEQVIGGGERITRSVERLRLLLLPES